ncbi:GNAT family N-acetyltransferase [Bacillus sp. BHET2]|uniref:GNAT family N-acetyltransferase n=1 Tax=Bacillus sp. BHET2 TaxID=2583818 RepID=UPI00110E8012|nr:GNAT family N-acetyltransferase [Bacillus sp. BHET2]TMU87527.1 GNAT family N-acetyltransferase [Bacillus sp. BHET2]
MKIHFIKIIEPESDMVFAMNRWDNDPALIPLIRPCKDKDESEQRRDTTLNEFRKRLDTHQVYLIYLDDTLVGEMNYMLDPVHLYRKVTGTAWIGITIGEAQGRGKGVGFKAIQFLEAEIKKQGHDRIELGVFEFNTQAYDLYTRLGYHEIGRIADFTYWNNKMWADIRMEKYINEGDGQIET